jgi:hypothetical protein
MSRTRPHATVQRSYADHAPDVAPPRGPRPSDHACDPSTSDRLYSTDEAEFLAAVEAYKATHKRRFLNATDYLKVAHSLGYRKVDR